MMTPAASGGSAHGGGGGANSGARLVAERRWRLGVHSRGHPHRIMEDLLRGLAAHAVAYKKQAPYNYKCRKLFPALGARAARCCSCPNDVWEERRPGKPAALSAELLWRAAAPCCAHTMTWQTLAMTVYQG
jgi:hypothetical protein